MMGQKYSWFYQEGPAQPQPIPAPRAVLDVAFSASKGELQTWACSKATQTIPALPALNKL